MSQNVATHKSQKTIHITRWPDVSCSVFHKMLFDSNKTPGDEQRIEENPAGNILLLQATFILLPH